MAEPRPQLVSVDGASVRREPSGSAGAPPARARGAVRGFWLMAVLLAVAVATAAAQTRRVAVLSDRVAGLTAEIDTARAALAAYRGQIEEVRTSVADLRVRLAALDALVHRGPAAPPPAPEP